METIAWIPLLPRIPDAAAVSAVARTADCDPTPLPEEADISPVAGIPQPALVVEPAARRERRPVLQGCRWRSIAVLAVVAAVVWGLAWRNERLRLASQRRGGERIASRPIDPADPSRSVVP